VASPRNPQEAAEDRLRPSRGQKADRQTAHSVRQTAGVSMEVNASPTPTRFQAARGRWYGIVQVGSPTPSPTPL